MALSFPQAQILPLLTYLHYCSRFNIIFSFEGADHLLISKLVAVCALAFGHCLHQDMDGSGKEKVTWPMTQNSALLDKVLQVPHSNALLQEDFLLELHFRTDTTSYWKGMSQLLSK